MGLRYRKSKKLGGGFRVNLSKSGIGYSWGVKGIRFTKKAGGGTRRTYSIPGTGISWVDESNKRKKRKKSKKKTKNTSTVYDNLLVDYLTFIYETGKKKRLAINNMIPTEALECSIDEVSSELKSRIDRANNILNIILWIAIILGIIGLAQPILLLIDIALILIGIKVISDSKISFDEDYYSSDNSVIYSTCEKINNNDIDIYLVDETNGDRQIAFSERKPWYIKTERSCYYINLSGTRIYIIPGYVIVVKDKTYLMKVEELSVSQNHGISDDEMEIFTISNEAGVNLKIGLKYLRT